MKYLILTPVLLTAMAVFLSAQQSEDGKADLDSSGLVMRFNELKLPMDKPVWLKPGSFRIFTMVDAGDKHCLAISASGKAFLKIRIKLMKGETLIFDRIISDRLMPGELKVLELTKCERQLLEKSKGNLKIVKFSAWGK